MLIDVEQPRFYNNLSNENKKWLTDKLTQQEQTNLIELLKKPPVKPEVDKTEM